MTKNKNCLYCGKKLKGKQKKYCCSKHQSTHYRTFPEHRKIWARSNRKRYLRITKRLIKESKEYYENNKEKAMNTKREYTMRKYHSDESFKMRVKLGTSLNYVIRHYIKDGKVLNPMAKYCIDWKGIIKQLSPFPKNRKDYHVDHIIPLCKFDLTNWEQIQIAFAPENHQWIKIKKNLIKGGRV